MLSHVVFLTEYLYYNINFYNFYLNMSDDIDKRLATISKACFENSDDLMSIYKVILCWLNFYNEALKQIYDSVG